MAIRRPIKTQSQKEALPFRYTLLLSSCVFIFLTILSLIYIDRQLKPTLTRIAEMEIQNIATHSINSALSNQLGEIIDINELIVFERNENGYVTSMVYDTQMYTQIMGATMNEIATQLRAVRSGEITSDGEATNRQDGRSGIVHEIPLGRATNNALLANLGPTVPIRFSTVSDVNADLRDKVERVSINSTRVSLDIFIEVDVEIIIPFDVVTETVEVTFPIGFAILNGPVPNYYLEGGGGMIVAPPMPETGEGQENH